MDDIVKAALAKWPHVPHCYGWLALDARGDWYMRDERIQRAGPFPQVKGSRVDHAKLKAFIERNYEADARGCWYFQNGPQRVYLQLEAAPWVWRLQQQGAACTVHSHTGRAAQVREALVDEQGRLFLATDLGLGLVHTQDMHEAAQALEQDLWPLHDVRFADLPAQFGYVLQPQPAAAQA
jgi:hypothetical protein